jgi:hypothetical protein
VERRVVTVTEIFVFKRFQPVLFGLFEFDPEMTLSVIDPINLRYRDVIAAKKGTCEPMPNNLVTAIKISPYTQHLEIGLHLFGLSCFHGPLACPCLTVKVPFKKNTLSDHYYLFVI